MSVAAHVEAHRHHKGHVFIHVNAVDLYPQQKSMLMAIGQHHVYGTMDILGVRSSDEDRGKACGRNNRT